MKVRPDRIGARDRARFSLNELDPLQACLRQGSRS